ncbi:hypothetical protein PR048_010839 [Dryococelus australis]|uniref:Uncharacterized protein n=1 Tax=Dryococelus australis TaxID=614101 RepID=A0ABQ9I5S4_9NEOP|nr:hypothetical protein PR048_010839 [Dryococelus australis]
MRVSEKIHAGGLRRSEDVAQRQTSQFDDCISAQHSSSSSSLAFCPEAGFLVVALHAFEMWMRRKVERISWVERVNNEEVLERAYERRKLLKVIRERKKNWMVVGKRESGTTWCSAVVGGEHVAISSGSKHSLQLTSLSLASPAVVPQASTFVWESCPTMPLVGGFFAVISRFPRQLIPVLLHVHLNPVLKTSMLRAMQNLFTHSLTLRISV